MVRTRKPKDEAAPSPGNLAGSDELIDAEAARANVTPDLLWRAQELYCVRRHSLAAVAEDLGVPPGSVRRWSERLGWSAKRSRLARARTEAACGLELARSAMVQKLLESPQPQVAFAVASLEKTALAVAEFEARQTGSKVAAPEIAVGWADAAPNPEAPDAGKGSAHE